TPYFIKASSRLWYDKNERFSGILRALASYSNLTAGPISNPYSSFFFCHTNDFLMIWLTEGLFYIISLCKKYKYSFTQFELWNYFINSIVSLYS
ncbi:12753_t:CDS:1, partial [Acaulospora morrowiae]